MDVYVINRIAGDSTNPEVDTVLYGVAFSVSELNSLMGHVRAFSEGEFRRRDGNVVAVFDSKNKVDYAVHRVTR
jgi:hypothetical protein